MENRTYSDLSLQTEKPIDLAYFLNKVKNNGYSTVALDYEITDPKVNVHVWFYSRAKSKTRGKSKWRAWRSSRESHLFLKIK